MKIIAGYISLRHIETGWCKFCEKYLYSGVYRKELFLQWHAKTQFILAFYFVIIKGRKDILLEKKKFRSDPAKTVNVLDAWKAQNINKQYLNKLYISKCKDYIFHDKKHLLLTDNYGDLINNLANRIQEPITKQHLNSCPKKATYLSDMTVKSLLVAINF